MKTFVTVHAVAVNAKNEYLILQRADHRSNPGTWNSVTGYIQDHESAETAALRELKEETNLTGEIIKTTEPFWADFGDTRWVVIASLIHVSDTASLKIDPTESKDYRWINLEDPIIQTTGALSVTCQKLKLI